MVAAVYDPTGQRKDIFNPQNIGASPAPNLLDNSDFRNLVNQNNKTSYTGGNGTTLFDRWKININATVSKQGARWRISNNQTKYGGIWQVAPLIVSSGDNFTFSDLFDSVSGNGWYIDVQIRDANSIESIIASSASGKNPIEPGNNRFESVTCAIPDGYKDTSAFAYCFIANNTENEAFCYPRYAKLERGERQTVAYKDSSGIWNLISQPDDESVTRLKCLRYYEKTRFFVSYAAALSEELINPLDSYQFEVEKRIAPTITVNETPSQQLVVFDTIENKVVSGCSLQVPGVYNKGMLCPKVAGSGFVVGRIYRISIGDNAYLISAEL